MGDHCPAGCPLLLCRARRGPGFRPPCAGRRARLGLGPLRPDWLPRRWPRTERAHRPYGSCLVHSQVSEQASGRGPGLASFSAGPWRALAVSTPVAAGWGEGGTPAGRGRVCPGSRRAVGPGSQTQGPCVPPSPEGHFWARRRAGQAGRGSPCQAHSPPTLGSRWPQFWRVAESGLAFVYVCVFFRI